MKDASDAEEDVRTTVSASPRDGNVFQVDRNVRLDPADPSFEMLEPSPGLDNFGASCFFNSALQMVAHCTPLAEAVEAAAIDPDPEDEAALAVGSLLAETLVEISDPKLVKKAEFRKRMKKLIKGMGFDPQVQEDASIPVQQVRRSFFSCFNCLFCSVCFVSSSWCCFTSRVGTRRLLNQAGTAVYVPCA